MSDLDKARLTINAVDKEMATLFEKRMDAVKQVAEYKIKHGIPVEDLAREEDILRQNADLIENEDYRTHYINFLCSVMEQSKRYQHQLMDETPVDSE